MLFDGKRPQVAESYITPNRKDPRVAGKILQIEKIRQIVRIPVPVAQPGKDGYQAKNQIIKREHPN